MRALAAALVFVAMTSSCGGAKPPPIAKVAAPKAATPGEACLELADVKHTVPANAPTKVGAKHVLVKWSGAKRADASITRTREQACLRAIEARDKVREGADFAEVVKTYSDEPGAATRGGTIGNIERGDVAPQFADAAFELELNQLSDVVETEFGFHVIFRTE